jgi:hypothetical protein
MASVLAMLYLVLFSTLAVGFYAAVNSSTQIAGSDRRTTSARLAAESGMQFMRHQLANLNVPAGTKQDELFDAVYERLSYLLDDSPNMAGHDVGVSDDGTTILVPGGMNYARVNDHGMEFRAELSSYGASGLRVKVIGRDGDSGLSSDFGARGVQLDYDVAQNSSSIFDYGVASRSRIRLNSNARIGGGANPKLGSVLSTSPLNPTLFMDSNAQVTGDVSFSVSNNMPTMGANSTIAGYDKNDAGLLQHVHFNVPEPEFPTVDTDVFKPFAGSAAGYGGTTITPPNSSGETKYSSGTIRNVLIKASPHADRWVVFDSDVKIDGIVYIETPNKIRFTGNSQLRGAIVVQNDATHNHTRNIIEFDSNAKIGPIEALAGTNNSYFPPAMTSLTGSTILAPKFKVRFNSNFGGADGSIIADEIHFDSNAAGLIRGSVVNLADTYVTMDGNANVTIETAGSDKLPAGVKFGSRYDPLPGSYREVRP